MRKSQMAHSAKPLARTPFKRKSPMPSTGILSVQVHQRTAPAKKAKAKAAQRGRATNAEREHMGRVAALGCCLCAHLNYGYAAAEVHHVRVRHGWGRSGHMNTIPLCPAHHTGQPGGVHDMGRDQFTALYGISEIELLASVQRRLGIEQISED
ncbi:MAG: Ref family recombination enhancement nuclease [Pseudomonadota bacterium]